MVNGDWRMANVACLGPGKEKKEKRRTEQSRRATLPDGTLWS